MSVRVKFVLVGVLLLLALGATIIATVATIQAFQGLQQQNSLVHAGDIRTVRAWMTIPYIARTYHVPESYLYQWLHITDVQKPSHDTLRLLAVRYHWSLDVLIQRVQVAIQTYRSQHPRAQTPSGSMIRPVLYTWTYIVGVFPCGYSGFIGLIGYPGFTSPIGYPGPPPIFGSPLITGLCYQGWFGKGGCCECIAS